MAAAPAAAAAAAAPAPLLLAESENGRQYKLCASCAAPAPLFCARCGLAPYCSPACQRKHWASHKPECAAPPSPPTNFAPLIASMAATLEKEGAVPADWEAPYPYIYVAPTASNPDIIPFIRGIAEALPLPMNALAGERSSDALNTRFQWEYSGTRHVLRGFSHEDAVVLRVWSSDFFAGRLPLNELGTTLLMIEGCRGGVVVEKYDMQRGVPLPLSRREVWEICSMRGYASVLGELTPRITRENTRRREAITVMKAMGIKFDQ